MQVFAGENRNDRQGDEIGGDQGESHRQGEWREKEPGNAGDENHGEEDHDRGDGRSENGQADFARTLDGRLVGRFAGAAMAVDVLQHDDGIVDQTADSQRQAAQGKGI